MADVLGAGLTLLGVPGLLTLPLWMYSIWVGGNALSGAIPKAGLGYSIGGVLISLIPALIGMGIAMGLVRFALAATGILPGVRGM